MRKITPTIHVGTTLKHTHLTTEFNVAAHQHPAGPVRGVRVLLHCLHFPHGVPEGLAGGVSLEERRVEVLHTQLGGLHRHRPQRKEDALCTRCQEGASQPHHTVGVDTSCLVICRRHDKIRSRFPMLIMSS